jgi:hypothetical protein
MDYGSVLSAFIYLIILFPGESWIVPKPYTLLQISPFLGLQYVAQAYLKLEILLPQTQVAGGVGMWHHTHLF